MKSMIFGNSAFGLYESNASYVKKGTESIRILKTSSYVSL